MPETTRIGRSAGIGIGSPAPHEALELFAVGAPEDPDEREINGQSPTDDCDDTGEAVTDRSFEPATEDHPDAEQCSAHRHGGDQLARDARSEPALDTEVPATVKNDVE